VEPAGATPTTLLTEPVVITVELPAAGATLAQVINELVNAANPTAQFLDSSKTAVVSGGTANAVDVTRILFSSGHAPESMAGVDPVGHRITSSDLSTFFDVSGTPNVMSEGDSLVLDFSSSYIRQTQQLSDSMASYLRIISNQTKNTARNAVVPIAKVFGGVLYLANGVSVEVDETRGFTVVGSSKTPEFVNVQHRPYLVVDAAGNGDYTTISAAITAATDGQVIFVRNGTYTEQLVLPSSKSIRIIGESRDGTLVTYASGPTIVDGAAAAVTHNYHFESLTIKNMDTTGFGVSLSTYQASADYHTTFYDCKFVRTASSTKEFFLLDKHSLEFDRCVFSGPGYDSGNLLFNLTGSASDQWFELRNSVVSNWGNVLWCTANTLKSLVIDHTQIWDCGKNDASTLDYAVDISGVANKSVISNTTFKQSSGAASDTGSLFLKVFDGQKLFTVHNCEVDSNISDNTLGAGKAVLELKGVTVSNCTFNSGIAALLLAGSNTVFTGNRATSSSTGTAVSTPWISCKSSSENVDISFNPELEYKNIAGTATGVYAVDLYSCSYNARFESNRLSVDKDGVTAVKIGSYARVVDNTVHNVATITQASYMVGVEVTGGHSLVSGNRLRDVGYGVYLTSVNCVYTMIAGNDIVGLSLTANCRAIVFDETAFGSADHDVHVSVVNNRMDGKGGNTAYGLYLANTTTNHVKKLTCGGNAFTGYAGTSAADWKPDSPGNTVGMGKTGVDADMSHNFYENGVL